MLGLLHSFLYMFVHFSILYFPTRCFPLGLSVVCMCRTCSVLELLKPRMSVDTSVITSLKLLVLASTSSFSKFASYSRLEKLEMLGFLSLSKLNFSLVFLAFFDPIEQHSKCHHDQVMVTAYIFSSWKTFWCSLC